MNPLPPSGAGPSGADTVKQCCARLYESDLVTRLLGDSFHPGGLQLTERLGEIIGLTPDCHLLDVAAGIGTSALFLAERFGCHVTGVDYSAANVERAQREGQRRGLTDRVRFERADAESLPFGDASFDAVICECAFCTFPAKTAAAREFRRVLRPGGHVVLSDITRMPGSSGELNDLMGWIACLADARSEAEYEAFLSAAGFALCPSETHDSALVDLVRQVQSRLLAAEILTSLQQLDLHGIDFASAKRVVQSALTAIDERRLGYAIVHGVRP